MRGTWWFNCRVLDLRLKVRDSVEALSCVLVLLGKTLDPLLSTGPTKEDWKIVDWDLRNRHKQINAWHNCFSDFLKVITIKLRSCFFHEK